jgi:hypothetical protein
MPDSTSLDRGPDPNAVRIGALRWLVVIATREQAADPDSAGILETIAKTQTVRADVQPIGPMTFYAAEQVDTPLTHQIVIRWLDWLDATCVVFRTNGRTAASASNGSGSGGFWRSMEGSGSCISIASWNIVRSASYGRRSIVRSASRGRRG